MQSRSKKPLKTGSGFTLIELMIAIAIFAILATIATPNAIRWLRNSQFNSAVMDVKNAIEDVRMHAVKNNAEGGIVFDGSSTFKTIKKNRITGNNTESEKQAPAGTTLTSSLGVNGELTYNSRGMLKDPSTDVTITIQNNNLGMTRTIEVDGVGSVRIQ
jgi:type IV fimbrial biogenesis protein FimU